MFKKVLISIMVAAILCLGFQAAASADENNPARSLGQTIYVPIYPYVYIHPKGLDLLLTSTLAIHNTDKELPITIKGIAYYDSGGKFVKEFLEAPLILSALASKRFLAEPAKAQGDGAGRSFIVEWESKGKKAHPPYVQSIMIGADGNQGISFTEEGRILDEIQ